MSDDYKPPKTMEMEHTEQTEQTERAEQREFVMHNIKLTMPQPKADFTGTDSSERPFWKFPNDCLYESICGNQVKLSLTRKRRGEEEVETVPYQVLHKKDGIILMRVHNHETPQLYELSDSQQNTCQLVTHDSYPYAYVVVDCRDGRCQMAIERTKNWNYNTESVRRCLEEGCGQGLCYDHGISVEIKKKTIAMGCIEFVDKRINTDGDLLKTVTLEFANRKAQPTARIPDPIARMMEGFSRQLEVFKAVSGKTTMQVAEENGRYDQQQLQILSHVVSMCVDNTFDLSFGFRDYGKYRANEEVEARFPMNDIVLSQFAKGVSVDFRDRYHNLPAWLDYVYEETIKVDNGIESKPKK